MVIVCPNCNASYTVSADSLGAEGRSVRCAHCREVWFAEPEPLEPVGAAARIESDAVTGGGPDLPTDVHWTERNPEADEPVQPEAAEAAPPPEGAPDTAVAPADTAPAVTVMPPEDVRPPTDEPAAPPVIVPAPSIVPAEAPEIAGKPEDHTPDYFEVRRRTAAQRQLKARPEIKSVRVIAALLGVIFALGYERENVVRLFPQSASFYEHVGLPVNLRGLEFLDVKTKKDVQDGLPVLLVDGAVKNITGKPVEVPRLRFSMRNSTGAEIYSWTTLPERAFLPAGETLAFQTRLASPPSDSRDVFVRFANRRDYATNIR